MQGVSANASVSFENSSFKADATSNVNAELSAGGTVSLKSGNDTKVAGANIEGRNVVAEVGGDLSVESRQDTYRSRSSQIGGSLSLSVGLGGSGTDSESTGAAGSNPFSDIAALPERAANLASDPVGHVNKTIDSVGTTIGKGPGAMQKTSTVGIRRALGCSFAPETPVLMANGSLRPIGSLRVGDWVASAGVAKRNSSGCHGLF